MTIRERVARQMRTCRDGRGWTQQQLAERIRVQRAYVTQIERGARGVSLDVLERLARAFRCSMGELLGERRSGR